MRLFVALLSAKERDALGVAAVEPSLRVCEFD
jgi:hypothetical protein